MHDASRQVIMSYLTSWHDVTRHALISHIWNVLCWIAWLWKNWNWPQEQCPRMSSSRDWSYVSLTSSVTSWCDVMHHALIVHTWNVFFWIAWLLKPWNWHHGQCSRMSSSRDRSYVSLTSSVTSNRNVRCHAFIWNTRDVFCWIV